MVTTGLSMVLALAFRAGPADVPVAELAGVVTLAFPLIKGFLPFPFAAAP